MQYQLVSDDLNSNSKDFRKHTPYTGIGVVGSPDLYIPQKDPHAQQALLYISTTAHFVLYTARSHGKPPLKYDTCFTGTHSHVQTRGIVYDRNNTIQWILDYFVLVYLMQDVQSVVK